jgi:hypothetical protein
MYVHGNPVSNMDRTGSSSESWVSLFFGLDNSGGGNSGGGTYYSDGGASYGGTYDTWAYTSPSFDNYGANNFSGSSGVETSGSFSNPGLDESAGATYSTTYEAAAGTSFDASGMALLNMSSFNGDLGQDYYRGAGEAWGAGEYGLFAGCALTGLCETTYSLAGTFVAVYAGLYVAQMVGVAIYGYASQLWRGGGVAEQGVKGGGNLSKPTISDPKLQNIVNDLYKGVANPNRIGTGTTADAIRNELLTGQSTSGRFHITKGQEYSRALEKWLNKIPNASYQDRLAAQSLLDDLKNALGVK